MYILESLGENLTEQQMQQIAASAHTEKYRKGDIVHRTDNECKGLVTVTSGQLRTYILSEEGREVTLFRVDSGEMCVLSVSCLLESITFDVIIEASEDTEISVIPVADINRIMEENPMVELFLYKAATEKFSEVMWTMQQILFLRIDQRIARFLWDEMIRQGSMTLSFTHDEIARYIGSVREVVSKGMKYLSQENIISVKRGTVEILSKEKLKKLI